jgi:hypothetical protein
MNREVHDPQSRPSGALPRPGAPGAPWSALAGADDPAAELRALTELLSDGTPEVFQGVSARLRELGEAGRSALVRAAADGDARRRGRARALLAELDRRRGLRRLQRAASRESLSLERGLLVLAALDGDRRGARRARAELDHLAVQVESRLTPGAIGFAAPLTLVQVLGQELGLAGPTDDYHHPDHVQLDRALELRRGLPLTLTAIYLSVAARVGLRAAGVALPGHVVLRLYAGEQSMLVDPFARGAVRTRRECVSYLLQRGLAPRAEWFLDCDGHTLFHRQVLNLAHSERLRGRSRAAAELEAVAAVAARVRGRHPAADPESA